jgi:hypothetical protein
MLLLRQVRTCPVLVNVAVTENARPADDVHPERSRALQDAGAASTVTPLVWTFSKKVFAHPRPVASSPLDTRQAVIFEAHRRPEAASAAARLTEES